MKFTLFRYRNQKPLLSEQDITIIKLYSREYSYRDIGFELNLSEKHVENQIEQIRSKVGAKNEVGIFIYALKNKIIEIDDRFK